MKKEIETQLLKCPAPLQLKLASGEVYATILKYDDFVEVAWTGHITSEDVISAAKVFLDLLKNHPCTKLLNNKLEALGDWQDANDWLEFEWLPQITKAGLLCMAHVYSSNMFSQLSSRDLINRVAPCLLIASFTERQQAINWLTQCSPGF